MIDKFIAIMRYIMFHDLTGVTPYTRVNKIVPFTKSYFVKIWLNN